MNILFVTPAFYPATYWGGPTFSLFGLCNSLAASGGHLIRVLTTDTAGPRLSERVAATGFPTRYPGGYYVYFTRRRLGISISPGLLGRLQGMIRWADVVHLTGTYSFPVIPTLLLSRVIGKPVVWTPNGALQRWPGTSNWWRKRLWERLCNSLLVEGRTVLHVTSEDEEHKSASRIPRAGVARIPYGVDLPALPAARLWQPGRQMRLIYIGRLDPIKGIENLLAALADLSDIEVQLSIVGRGATDYEHELQSLVAELRLSRRVHFLGFAEGTKKSRAFFDADICVVPSYTENFGLVVAEALAHGVPVIASRGTPWAELERRGCGKWVDNSPENLATAIRWMNTANLREMGAKGRAWMEEDFSWAKAALSMDSVYRRLA